MKLVGIFEVLIAFFKFPGEVTSLIRMLSNTPQQEHNKLLLRVKEAFDESKTGGRPS